MIVTSTFTFNDIDWRCSLEIEWMSQRLRFNDWEPEDANISRDFNDVMNITDLIKEANELGLQWKKITIEKIEHWI